MTDKFAGVENAGLEIDRQKLQGVENDQGHLSLSTNGDKCATVNFGGNQLKV